MLRPAGPGQVYRVYGDLFYHGITNARFHGHRSSFILWFAVARFLTLTILLDINYTRKREKCQIFCEKIAKNVKTGSILANFSFLSSFFAEKSGKMSNSREKLPKMVKSDFNLANVVFFCKFFRDIWFSVLLSTVEMDNGLPFCRAGLFFVVQDRQILPCLRSGDLKLQKWRGTGPRPTFRVAISACSERIEVPMVAALAVARGPVPRDVSSYLNQDLQDYWICRILSLAVAGPLFIKTAL